MRRSPGRFDKHGLCDHAVVSKQPQRSRPAHEHYRVWQSLSAIAARVAGSVSVGTVRVQRHLCRACAKSYSEQSASLVRGSWYAREVHRASLDRWQRLGTSLRRTVEVLWSWLGRQERSRLWRPLDDSAAEPCYLAASVSGLI